MNPHNARIVELETRILQETTYLQTLERENIDDTKAFMESRSMKDDKSILQRIGERKVSIKASKSYLTRMKNELEHLQKSNENTTFDS